MWAHRVKAHVSPNRPLTVDIPTDAPEGDAEVIVLVASSPGSGQPRFTTLRELTCWLEQQPGSGRSKEEIDRHIAEERASWE